MNSESLIAIAAGAAVAITGMAAAFGIGAATQKAVESAARQPEAANSILRILVLGASLVEATAVYALIIGLIILFTK